MHAFQKQYSTVAVPKLTTAKQYASPYLIPKISRVVVNMGIGDLATLGKTPEDASAFIATMTGQQPVVVKARKAIAGFKIRAGMPVGVKVTLRGPRMHDFLIKFTQVVLPRTRDFRGITPTSIAPDGSLHLGIKDSTIFPETTQGSFQHPLQVTLVATPACSPDEARLLYEALGFVFQAQAN